MSIRRPKNQHNIWHQIHVMSFMRPQNSAILWHLIDKNHLSAHDLAGHFWHLISMDNFHGRDQEIDEFLQLIHPQRSNLATCQGRRRIGKSMFIRQCGNLVDHYYSISGLAPQADLGKRDQLENLAAGLSQSFGRSRAHPRILATSLPSPLHPPSENWKLSPPAR